jgi:hypothetical protein
MAYYEHAVGVSSYGTRSPVEEHTHQNYFKSSRGRIDVLQAQLDTVATAAVVAAMDVKVIQAQLDTAIYP